MGNRRRIRGVERIIKIIIINILFITVLFAQGEFQICTIPQDAFMMSSHRGMSAYTLHQPNRNQQYSLTYMQFPDDIHYSKMIFNKFSLSLLDYGTLEDKIDENILYDFKAYDVKFEYFLSKKILDKFLLTSTSGFLYSKIDNVDSFGLSADFKVQSQLDIYNLNFAFSIKNFGVVLDAYTNTNIKFPLISQIGVLYNLHNTSIDIGYDFKNYINFKEKEHVVCFQFPLSTFGKLRMSYSNTRENLLIGDYKDDWFYGLGFGLSIDTKKTSSDFSLVNIGPAGFIYAISFYYKQN